MRFFEGGGFELTVLTTFTRPIIEGVTKFRDSLGYIVPMNKLPNRFPNGIDSLRMHFLNFTAERNYQEGFAYHIWPNFPRRCLPMVTYLHSLNLIDGFDIDELGYVTYDEEL